MEGENNEPEPSAEEEVRQEQHLPTTEERLEHCYGEIRQLRLDLEAARAHTHDELAHAIHEHGDYAHHEHKHEIPDKSDTTSEPVPADTSGAESSPTPSSKHPWFRPIGR